MRFKYQLNERPPWGPFILLALQWMAIAVPFLLIMGKVVAGLHYADEGAQIGYLQKIFFVTGVFLLTQIVAGHRLPLVPGPAMVLIIGISASAGSSIEAIYTAIFLGGLTLALVSLTGLFGRLQSLFTPRIVCIVLLLLSVLFTPTIINLLNSDARLPLLTKIGYVLTMLIVMFYAHKKLSGIWQSTLILWTLFAFSSVYWLLFPGLATGVTGTQLFTAVFLTDFTYPLVFNPGLIMAFLICFIVVVINEVGSIQSAAGLIQPDNLNGRLNSGILISGLSSMLAGAFGVVGPVSYAISAGVVASTGSASRYTLVPAALGLLVISFFPVIITGAVYIPQIVVAGILIYLMTSLISSALLLITNNEKGFKYEDGVIIGLPLMLGLVVAFLPATALKTLPDFVKPLISNGFVVGVVAALMMEHLIYKD